MNDSNDNDRPSADDARPPAGTAAITPAHVDACEMAPAQDDEPTVGDLMGRSFLAIPRSTPLAAIASGLLQMPQPCAIVVDEDSRCVGLMRVGDALRALIYHLPAFDTRLPVRTNAQADVALLMAHGPLVAHVTVPFPRHVTAAAPASTAAAWMAFHEIEWLPVVGTDGRPVGLLGALDLLRAGAVRDGHLVVRGVVRPPPPLRLLN